MAIGNLFNEEWYLKNNPDVRAAVEAGLVDARTHFELHGRFEGRSPDPLFNPAQYLAANPDVRAAVEAGLTSAYDHFIQFGASEGRSPVSLFDPEFYLAQNPDVRAAVEAGLVSATEHFLMYGQSEPRQINPFINLGDYLNANSDLKEAAEAGAFSPLTHLLIHGAAEDRDLGNGINLGTFANDPAYKAAIQSGDFAAAMDRVGEVAPFLPSFEPPVGWEPAPDTPIPTDFTPPEGTKLVIPPSVEVPDDMELPDTFEPVEPGPGPSPDPDPGPGPTPPTPKKFKAELDNGTVVFSNVKDNRIDVQQVEEIDGSVVFTSGGQDSDPISTDDIEKILVPGKVTLAGSARLLELLSITSDDGQVKVIGSGDENVASLKFESAEGLILSGTVENGVSELNLTLDDSYIRMPKNASENLLTHNEGQPAASDPANLNKKLTIESLGVDSVDLGNPISAEIGYFLTDVTITGTGASLDLSTLYFGAPGTKFDSKAYAGGIHLDAYVYHGNPGYEWSIEFGAGNDTLRLRDDPGTTWDIPPAGGKIDGGGGDNNTLFLEGSLYANWKNHKGVVTNFQTVIVEKGTSDSEIPIDVDASNFEHADRVVVSGNALSVENIGDGKAVGFNNLTIDVVGTTFLGETGSIFLSDVTFANEDHDTEIEVFGDDLQTLNIIGSGIDGVLSIDVGYPGEEARHDGGFAPNLKTVNISVFSDIELSIDGDNFAGIQTLNASGSSGGITADMSGKKGAGFDPLPSPYSDVLSLTSLEGGQGNDMLTARLQLFGEEAVSINMNDGDDHIILFANEDIVEGTATALDIDLGLGEDILTVKGFGNVIGADDISFITLQNFSVEEDRVELNMEERDFFDLSELNIEGADTVNDALGLIAGAMDDSPGIALFSYKDDAYLYAKNSDDAAVFGAGDGLIVFSGISDVTSLEDVINFM